MTEEYQRKKLLLCEQFEKTNCRLLELLETALRRTVTKKKVCFSLSLALSFSTNLAMVI